MIVIIRVSCTLFFKYNIHIYKACILLKWRYDGRIAQCNNIIYYNNTCYYYYYYCTTREIPGVSLRYISQQNDFFSDAILQWSFIGLQQAAVSECVGNFFPNLWLIVIFLIRYCIIEQYIFLCKYCGRNGRCRD